MAVKLIDRDPLSESKSFLPGQPALPRVQLHFHQSQTKRHLTMTDYTQSPEMTDGFHLVIDALKLNGIDTIFGVPECRPAATTSPRPRFVSDTRRASRIWLGSRPGSRNYACSTTVSTRIQRPEKHRRQGNSCIARAGESPHTASSRRVLTGRNPFWAYCSGALSLPSKASVAVSASFRSMSTPMQGPPALALRTPGATCTRPSQLHRIT